MAHLLEVRGLSKSYPGVRALDAVNLQVGAGEVRAVAGENGAGKSTLVRLLAGMQRPDSGEIHFDGRPVHLRTPHDALRVGISVIHQELMLFPDLSVAENVCMGREPVRGRLGWVDRAAMRSEAARLLARLKVSIDPGRRLGTLSIAEMQMVEIAKALGYRSRLIVMDEPTSAISEREVEVLLGLIDELGRGGVAIVYISHRMKELFRIASSVTVLRDGRHAGTHSIEEVTEDRLIALMAGRELGAMYPARTSRPDEVALEVRALGRKGCFRNVSLSVRRGEILGIAGLMGSGRSSLVGAIYGLAPATEGEIRVNGTRARIRTPSDALASGIALVTEDRKQSGIVPEMAVSENLTLASLGRYCRGPFVRTREEVRAADRQIERFSIRTPHRRQKIRNLSGGNQQKVMIGRALLAEPAVLLLDEPTRGIDVNAKSEVYGVMAQLAAEGMAMVMVSSELPEVLAMSDRIVVMREGEVAVELDPRETNAEEVLRHAMPR